jgi:hypothetical protein
MMVADRSGKPLRHAPINRPAEMTAVSGLTALQKSDNGAWQGRNRGSDSLCKWLEN